MGSRLAGKVALIAGSSSGIGRAGAVMMAEEGAMPTACEDPERDRASPALPGRRNRQRVIRYDNQRYPPPSFNGSR